MGQAIPGSEGFHAASTQTEAEPGNISERSPEPQVGRTLEILQ